MSEGSCTLSASVVRPQRWCIYIDILGFSALWESENSTAVGALRKLMQAIYRIGAHVYPNEGERLFVHQMGDGFAIVSDFNEPTLERPLAIAIALMRAVASGGAFAAAAIAEGEFSDIAGCYPEEVIGRSDEANSLRLGTGLMTLSTVMGAAFIRAYRLSHDAPSGPFLTVPECQRDRIPPSYLVRPAGSKKGTRLLSIDWVRAATTLLSRIQKEAGLGTSPPDAIARAVKDYYGRHESLVEKWSLVPDLLDIDTCSDVLRLSSQELTATCFRQ